MKLISSTVLLLSLFSCAFGQEARKIGEFGDLNCEELLNKSDAAAQELNRIPNSKLFIIFYEGKHRQPYFNKKNKELESVLVNPRYGEAKNKAKAITLYLTKWRKLPKENFLLFDGGFDTEFRVEVWLLIDNPSLPKPSPSLKNGETNFRKGKAPKVRDCEGYYRSI